MTTAKRGLPPFAAALAAALALSPAPGAAAEPARVRIAMLGGAPGPGIDEKTAASVEELLLNALQRTGRFALIGRSDIAGLIGFERQKQLVGCNQDNQCAAEIAGAMGVSFLAMTSFARLGSTFILSMKIIQVAGARVAVRVERRVRSEDDLPDAVDALAADAVAGCAAEGCLVEKAPAARPAAVQPIPAVAAPVPAPAASPEVAPRVDGKSPERSDGKSPERSDGKSPERSEGRAEGERPASGWPGRSPERSDRGAEASPPAPPPTPVRAPAAPVVRVAEASPPAPPPTPAQAPAPPPAAPIARGAQPEAGRNLAAPSGGGAPKREAARAPAPPGPDLARAAPLPGRAPPGAPEGRSHFWAWTLVVVGAAAGVAGGVVGWQARSLGAGDHEVNGVAGSHSLTEVEGQRVKQYAMGADALFGVAVLLGGAGAIAFTF